MKSTIFLGVCLISYLLAACDQNVFSDKPASNAPQVKLTVTDGSGAVTYDSENASFRITNMRGGAKRSRATDSLFTVWPPFGYLDSSVVSIDTTIFSLLLQSGTPTTTNSRILLQFERIGSLPEKGSYDMISGKSIRRIIREQSSVSNHLNDSLAVRFHVLGNIGNLTFLTPDSGDVIIQQASSAIIGGTFHIWVSHFVDNTSANKNVLQPMTIVGSFTAINDTTVAPGSVTFKPVTIKTGS